MYAPPRSQGIAFVVERALHPFIRIAATIGAAPSASDLLLRRTPSLLEKPSLVPLVDALPSRIQSLLRLWLPQRKRVPRSVPLPLRGGRRYDHGPLLIRLLSPNIVQGLPLSSPISPHLLLLTWAHANAPVAQMRRGAKQKQKQGASL